MTKLHPFKHHFLSKETIIFTLLTLASIWVLTHYVRLTPQIDNDFFFSNDDPHFQADRQISKLFERRDGQVIISIEGDIFSGEYQSKVNHLTKLLATMEEVVSVKSITDGPKSVLDATRSPFWKRLLIAKNQKSSNIVMIVAENSNETLIPKVENLVNLLQADNFQIKISGFPYIVELIRRHLVVDLQVFSSLAFGLFGIVVILIFHSWRVFFGMVVTCGAAYALTFMLTHLLDIKIGILTANLATIIFVLTLSHIVFLTFNWKHLHRPQRKFSSSVSKAIKITYAASFWAMATTLMGFLSLLFVPAKPLKELGVAGVIGTIIAFCVAFTIYPPFLRLKEKSHLWADRYVKMLYEGLYHIFEKIRFFIIAAIVIIIAIGAPALRTIDTDPPLISYFKEGNDIRNGLEYIDKNGGSSPLILILKAKSGETLNSNHAFNKLWEVQQALEKHPDIGTIMSLSTLMAEGKRLPFSMFLIWEWFLDALEKPRYGRIAKSFISDDRQYGLFLIRMNELNRTTGRLDVIDQIKTIVGEHDFEPYLVGGIYALQGHLSKLVASSLITGLGRLILLFTIVAFVVSHTFQISLAMTLSIAIVPLFVLGGIGFLKIPLDTISAPACNVAISMGIDAMIHMTHTYRRLKRHRGNDAKRWKEARRQMWEPVITSMFIVSSGFAIFFFSAFPPTQRFGGAIVVGTIVAAMTTLFIFPLMATKLPFGKVLHPHKQRKAHPSSSHPS